VIMIEMYIYGIDWRMVERIVEVVAMEEGCGTWELVGWGCWMYAGMLTWLWRYNMLWFVVVGP